MPQETLYNTDGISPCSEFTVIMQCGNQVGNIQPDFMDKPKLLSSFNTSLKEEEDEQPSQPTGLATDHLGSIYIVDSQHQTLKKFATDGRPLSSIKLQKPWGVTVLKNGSICVTDLDAQCVKVIRPQGQHMTTIGQGYLGEPRGVAENESGELLVSDTKPQRILVFKPHTVDCFGMNTSNATCTYSLRKVLPVRSCPWGIAVNPINNNIVVSNNSGHCVHVLSPKGEEFFQHGTTGQNSSDPGQCTSSHPSGVCVDRFGHIFMTDCEKDAVVILCPDGQSTLGYVSVKCPVAVTVSHVGHLLVARQNGWIDIYQYLK